MPQSELARLARRIRDAIDWHRRAVSAVLAGIAVLAGLHVLTPHPPRAVAVWTAARDLAGGSPLRPGDVVLRPLVVRDVPTAALTASVRVLGRLLAAPMRRGEPLTDLRLLGPSLLSALGRPGLVAVPVRVADGAAAAALVHAGDIVDVLGTTVGPDGEDRAATVVAAGVTVLALPARDGADDAASDDAAGLVIVAVTRVQAAGLAAAAGDRLSVVLART